MGKLLIGMPDATSLITVNIDSIQVEMLKGKTNNKQEKQTDGRLLYKHEKRCHQQTRCQYFKKTKTHQLT